MANQKGEKGSIIIDTQACSATSVPQIFHLSQLFKSQGVKRYTGRFLDL